jgi:hypothetical protein
MRIACIVGTLLATGGCAQLVGAEDPVAQFEVSPQINGHYVLALDVSSTTSAAGIYRFNLHVEAYSEDRVLSTVWFAYGATGPDLVSEDIAYVGAELANELELNFPFDLTLDIPAGASPGGSAVRLIGEFDGRFPALDGETATTDGFCGDASGTVSIPTDGTFDASFAAVKLEVGQDPPEPGQAFTDCADF